MKPQKSFSLSDSDVWDKERGALQTVRRKVHLSFLLQVFLVNFNKNYLVDVLPSSKYPLFITFLETYSKNPGQKTAPRVTTWPWAKRMTHVR